MTDPMVFELVSNVYHILLVYWSLIILKHAGSTTSMLQSVQQRPVSFTGRGLLPQPEIGLPHITQFFFIGLTF